MVSPSKVAGTPPAVLDGRKSSTSTVEASNSCCNPYMIVVMVKQLSSFGKERRDFPFKDDEGLLL